MYQVRDLVKIYEKKVILKNLNLDFSPGKFYALLGKNGSGKSTFMRLLAQQELYQEGDILYKGLSLLSPTLQIHRKIAFINEDVHLPIGKSLFDWAKIFSDIHSYYHLETFENLIKLFNLDSSKNLESLSRGQKAKAYFALHAAKKPDIYLLDEITSVLDTGSRVSMMQYLHQEAQRGALILMSTNIASELQGHATDLCILDQGQLEFSASVEDVGREFCKVLATDEQIKNKKLIDKGFRFLEKNSDNSWSLLIRRRDFNEGFGLFEDRRSVSIHELAIYFTGGAS